MSSATTTSIQIADLLDALRTLGFSPPARWKRIDLRREALRDRTVRLPARIGMDLLEAAAQRLNDPLIGLRAGMQARSRGPIFFLLLSKSPLSEGLRLMQRFAPLAIDTQRREVRTDDGVVSLTIHVGDVAAESSPASLDYLAAVAVTNLRRAVPGFELRDVALPHEEAGAPGGAGRLLGCPVHFGGRSIIVRFPDSMLGSVPAAASEVIARQIEKFAQALLEEVGEQGITQRVANSIRSSLAFDQRVDRSLVAKQLHLSERTLQRQLKADATTFDAVRTQVSSELACALLANPVLTVKEIAASVGFADAASFSKAFARWNGCGPTRYREAIAAHGRRPQPPRRGGRSKTAPAPTLTR